MILAGSSGYAFFIKEVLLAKGFAQKVALVNDINEAEQKIQQADDYHFFIIDLEESWEVGIQIAYEWQRRDSPLRLFLVPPDMDLPQLTRPNIAKEKPATLAEFVTLIYAFCQEYCETQTTFHDGTTHCNHGDSLCPERSLSTDQVVL
jgi:hypothetical protein